MVQLLIFVPSLDKVNCSVFVQSAQEDMCPQFSMIFDDLLWCSEIDAPDAHDRCAADKFLEHIFDLSDTYPMENICAVQKKRRWCLIDALLTTTLVGRIMFM